MRQRHPLEERNANRARHGLQISNAADTATIYLYDTIGGYDGIMAVDVAQALARVTAPKIALRINSAGGDVFEGRAIATAVRAHPAEVTAYVDGVAASAASWIAIAAREVVMARGSFLMIHNASAVVIGDRNDMLAMAQTLQQLDESFIADYSVKTGQEVEQIRAWMDAETWFSAEDAVARRFADRVDADVSATNSWDVSIYRNAPAALLKQPQPAPASPAPDNSAAIRDMAARRLALLERLAA
jgi:ATP-dependent Clp protease protease subunit